MPEPDSDEDEDEPIPDATIPDVVALVQQEPVTHPYHDMYMQEFCRLHEDNRRLHCDYSELYDSVCEINIDMVEFGEEFYTFRDNQQARNQHVNSLVTDMHRLTRVLEEDMKIVQPQAVEEHGDKTKKNGICLTDA
ncbi:unnamed protein product [Lactuca virosa]|uniref:Uncharacterized protein n=1 Tax=Lactuca virosa TaxID=75947 RepID=A0AAU9LW29_9ASTR|nr:unnamed protein product [Lactuca virosa]